MSRNNVTEKMAPYKRGKKTGRPAREVLNDEKVVLRTAEARVISGQEKPNPCPTFLAGQCYKADF